MLKSTGNHLHKSFNVLRWTAGDSGWEKTQLVLDDDSKDKHSDETVAPHTSEVCIIFAPVEDVRLCATCRNYFTNTLCMPKLWWNDYWAKHGDDYQRRVLNGNFGCEDVADDNGVLTGHVSWMRALIKYTIDNSGWIEYGWHKLNFFVKWSRHENQTVLVVFDADKAVFDRIPDAVLQDINIQQFHDPFWIYPRLLELVIRFQNQAVWAIRGSVRMLEKNRTYPKRPSPDYIRMHEIARHASHVSETLDVTLKTAAIILLQHAAFLDFEGTTDQIYRRHSKHIQDRLRYFEHVLFSLRARSGSNKERLSNEIGLAFNTVAQYDSRVSLDIGRAAQSDSNAMKTIAFLTLTFLPATYISAVFSMSFFDYDSDSGDWHISEQFWLYWVIAVPVTLLTTLAWYFWTRTRSPEPLGE